MPSKLPIPNKRLSPNDVETYVEDINEVMKAVDDSVSAYNQQIDAKELAESYARIAKEQADRASTIVLSPLLQIRKSKLDTPLTHLFKKNKLVDALHGPLIHKRESGATYIDRHGMLKYSPSSTATNVALWSEDFSQPVWGKVGVSITDNASVAPDGTITASKMSTVSNGNRYLHQATDVTETNNTFSVYLKQGTVSFGYLYIVDSSSAVASWTFDLNYGSVGKNVSASLASTAIIEDVGSGWFRCSVTVSGTALGSVNYRISAAPTISVNTTEVGDCIYQWGAQFEQSLVANVYVKTAAVIEAGASTLSIDQSRQESKGWLCEGTSTNLQTYSNDDSQETSGSATATLNATSSPDGVIAATKIEDTSTEEREYFQKIKFGVDETQYPAGIYTHSFYIKKGSSRYAHINAQLYGVQTFSSNAVFDFDTATFNNAEFQIIDVMAGGWFRVASKALTTTTGNQYSRVLIRPAVGSTGVEEAETGYCYVFGFQLEALPFASSYIPTTDSIATRSADIISAGVNNNVIADGLSLSIKLAKLRGFTGAYRTIFQSSPLHGSALVRALSTANVLRFNWAGSVANNNNAVFTPDETISLVATASSVKNAVWINGIAVTDYDTTTPILDINEKINIGQDGNGSNNLFGHLNDFRIYDFELNEDEVAFLAGE